MAILWRLCSSRPAKACLLILSCVVLLLVTLLHRSMKIGFVVNESPVFTFLGFQTLTSRRAAVGSQSETFECITGRPCDNYTDDVDFRIIVLTHNRYTSLLKLLHSLQDLELDGDRAVIEIWIDVNTEGRAHNETVQAARSFRWKKGPTRVHMQTSHAGIMGQWIDTWRPRPESRELGLILEDDLSVSPMAYRWLKGVHRGMKNRVDFVGATLSSDKLDVFSSAPKGPLAAPKNDTMLMYKCFGTQGFSPKPQHWRNFQVISCSL